MTDRPGGGQSGRRALVVLAVLAAVAGVVAVSRAGLRDAPPSASSPTPAPTPAGTPVRGRVLTYAAGEARIFALVRSCTGTTCGVRLVTSGNEGYTWQEGALPFPAATAARAAAGWRLTVAGPDDRLTIEDARTLRTSYDAGRTFSRLPISDGAPVERVPSNQEPFARLCRAPRCARPAVEFLQPRTGVRGRLAHQPPFPPAALTVEGSQLWTAGVDPRTRRWAVAVSTDDGASWDPVVLPPYNLESGLVGRVLPVPGQDQAYLVLSRPPQGDGPGTVYGVWTIGNPRLAGTAALVRPNTGGPAQVESAVASVDGRLLVAAYAVTGLAPDGVVDGQEADVPLVVRGLGRGVHSHVAAIVDDDDPVAGLAVSDTGAQRSWRIARIYLPDR